MNLINFIPEGTLFIVEIPEISDKTPAGVIKSPEIMETERKNQDAFVTVLAVPENHTSGIVPGDKILVNWGLNPSVTEIDGQNCGIVPHHAILGRRPKKEE